MSDIRSAALAAFDAQSAKEDETAATPEVVSGDLETTAETPVVEPQEAPKGERPRDETGKFAPKKGKEPEEQAPKPIEAKESVKTDPVKTDDKPAIEPKLEPPSNWSAADKATFGTVDAKAQKFLIDRHNAMQADYTRKTQEIAAIRNDYQPVAEMLAPYSQQMKASGFTPHTLIQSWMNVEREFVEGRGVNVIKNIVSSYKIDPNELAKQLGFTGYDPAKAAPAQQNPPYAQLPPQVQQELQLLRQATQQHHQFITEQQQRRQLDAETSIVAQLKSFEEAKADDGALLHPHYAVLENAMARLADMAIKNGEPVPSLKELYETAAWANPSVRATLQQAQLDAAEARRKTEARAKAEAARKAGSSVAGAPGISQAPEMRRGQASLRDAIAEAFDDSM